MNRNELTRGVILLLLLLATLTPLTVSATEIWSDDFSDGNLDEWTTAKPERFTATNGYLECLYNATSTTDLARITSDTNFDQQYGTWSFDFRLAATYMRVQFYDPPLRLVFTSDQVRLEYKRPTVDLPNVYATWIVTGYLGTWGHVDITIQESFVIDVFINGTHRMHYEGVTLAACEAFAFEPASIGDALDNIVISDTIDIVCENEACTLEHYTPPDTTPTTSSTTTDNETTPLPSSTPMELLAVISIGAVLIIVVVILKVKR
ncbi:MAG: hypothetical protein JW779_15815 [Candidatus Thorarchaeota archaeon]|nr:hypothetical protein [Candidatus Thorarchaeota archaeon]